MSNTDWDAVALGDAGIWVSGGTPSTSNADYWGGDIPWMSAKSMTEFRVRNSDRRLTLLGAQNGTKLVPKDVILMVVRGMSLKTEFRMGITQREVALSQDLKALIPDSQFDPLFLAYAIQSKTPEVLRMVDEAGHGTGRLQTDRLFALELPKPPIEEQRAIAATVDALDERIDSNRRAATTALALARAHVDKAVDGRGRAPLSSAMTVHMGAAFKGNRFSTPGVGRPLLRIRDLKTFESQTWTTEVRGDETVIHAGDIVVGMDAEFRATLWLGADSVLNQRVCSFRGQSGVGRAFVLAALEPQLAFQERAKTGTTVIHLNKADIDTFTVPELTGVEHRSLSEATEPLIDLAVARTQEVRALARARALLLPELVSGRVRVPAEAAV